MVKIRLARSGAKKNPYYFITVADERKPRDGSFIERLGFFNPSAKGQEERLRVDNEKIDLLSKTFNSYINYNFSQMFSFIKNISICEKNITITFNGEFKNYKNIINKIKINYLSDASIIHKENENEFFTLICQNQTCSKKLKNIQEIENYLENLHNVQ